MTMTPERLAELDAVMAKATACEDEGAKTWSRLAAGVQLFDDYPDLRALIDAQAAVIAELRIHKMRYEIALRSIGKPEPLNNPDAHVCGIIARSALDFVAERAALRGAA